MSNSLPDSPLDITSSIAGILTFVVAIIATIYARLNYLRNADQEYFQVKSSLSWYKTESAFLHDLVNATDRNGNENENAGSGGHRGSFSDRGVSEKRGEGMGKEFEMYAFVLDQLVKLEERLLALVTAAEIEAEKNLDGMRNQTFVPAAYMFPSSVAVAWLKVRTKALDLVRQRDALGSRVLFAQMSMISSKVIAQEERMVKLQEEQKKAWDGLRDLALVQNGRLLELEGLLRDGRGPGLKSPSLVRSGIDTHENGIMGMARNGHVREQGYL